MGGSLVFCVGWVREEGCHCAGWVWLGDSQSRLVLGRVLPLLKIPVLASDEKAALGSQQDLMVS